MAKALHQALQLGLAYGAASAVVETNFAPLSWAICSACVWLIYTLSRGWGNLGTWDRHHLAWGLASIAGFLQYLLVLDTDFQVRCHHPAPPAPGFCVPLSRAT